MAVDGEIDYGTLSREQLEEALTRIDRVAFPRNHANLVAELERRRAAEPAATVTARADFGADFGPAAARAQNNDFEWSGSGSVGVDYTWLYVAAERKPFLGTAESRTASFPLTEVVNVEHADRVVRVEIYDGATTRKFHAWFATSAEASALARMLPTRRTATFRPALGEARDFQEMLGRISSRPMVVPALVAANALVFLLVAASGGGWIVPAPEVLVTFGSNYTPYTAHGEPWRLFTSTFLHFGLAHFALNAWALWAQGPLAERLYGRVRFAVLYLASGLAGSIASLVWHPVVNSAGASGAIFGVYGGLLAYFLRHRDEIPSTIFRQYGTGVAIFIVVSLVNGLRVAGIDNAAHLGGLVAGFVVGAGLAVAPSDASQGERAPRTLYAVLVPLVLALIGGISATQSPWARARAQTNPEASSALASVEPVRELWGVSLRMTREQVRAAKGEPTAARDAVWTYDALDSAHDALVDVAFDADGQVAAVFYSGDGSGAPSGVPPIRTRTDVRALRERYGPPTFAGTAEGDRWYVRFANGVAAGGQGETAHFYGIDVRPLRQDPAGEAGS